MADQTVPLTIVTRQQAVASGIARYFTGKPCKHGHTSERWAANHTCVDCLNATLRKRYAANPAVDKARAVKWQKKNKAKYRKRARQRHAENPQIGRANGRRATTARRARKVGAGGRYTAADLQRIYRQQRGRCAMPECRKRLGDAYHVDHIRPLARGGSSWPHNLQLLCEPCNLSKGAKDPIDHAKQSGRLL